MRRKQEKGTKAVIATAVVAGILVIALLLAGTLLRMNTRDMGFLQALASFLRDTFTPGAFEPGT